MKYTHENSHEKELKDSDKYSEEKKYYLPDEASKSDENLSELYTTPEKRRFSFKEVKKAYKSRKDVGRSQR